MPTKYVSSANEPLSAVSQPEITRSFIKKRESLGPKASTAKRQKKFAEEQKWILQYLQERSISDFEGMGCGWCTFDVRDPVPFKSPYHGEMRFEIQTGIRFVGPEFWSGSFMLGGVQEGNPLTILYPFENTGMLDSISA